MYIAAALRIASRPWSGSLNVMSREIASLA
jgi:hypothetical protein